MDARVRILSDEDLAAAQRGLDELLARGRLDSGEMTYLDALSDLVESYENEAHPFPQASDADMLRHLLDAKGITQIELSHDAGVPRLSLSEILAGKKPLSRQMIRKLAAYFDIDPGVLAASL